MSFSDRLTRAADIARRAHNHQTRKGSDVPYLSHLFAVAALVMESGGSEDQVCAALLHDVLEDAGVSWSDEIRAELGEHVLALVVACTDGLPDAEGHKESWRTRKHRYIEHCSQDTPLEREALVICASALPSHRPARARARRLPQVREGRTLASRQGRSDPLVLRDASCDL